MADRRRGSDTFTIRGVPLKQATIDVMNTCRMHIPAKVVRVRKEGQEG